MTEPGIVVRVPWQPVHQVSPNARVATRTRRAHIEASRDAALLATRSALAGHRWTPPDGTLALAIVIAWGRGRQRMDLDNAVCCCKGIIDGVTRALGVDDRRIVRLAVEQRRDPDRAGYVELALRSTRAED